MQEYLWLLRFPAAFLLGLVVQWFYLPGTSYSPIHGIIGILFMCAGSCTAYYFWWR